MESLVVFAQQAHDSNWVPFFKGTIGEAQELGESLIKTKEYDCFYICRVLNFYSMEDNDGNWPEIKSIR